MAEDLKDRVYLLIGGSGGIGSAVARRLVSRGARVALAGRNEETLAELAGTLDLETHTLDAADFDAVEACARRLHEAGPLTGIANLAGSILLKPAHLTTADDWSRTVSANLTSAFAAVRAAGKVLGRDGGSVVLMSSAAARLGLPNHEAIAAAKAGIEGLARSAAATYGARGLRFNVVAPGLTRTPMTARITSSEASENASASLHALGRIGEPDEVAAAVEWLLDPSHGWVTGQVLGVDGGLGVARSRSA